VSESNLSIPEAASSLEALLRLLTETERLRFLADLMVAVRKPSPEMSADIKTLLDRWATTITVRSHPQFAIDVKGFKSMIEDGSAFDGLDLAVEQQARLQSEVVSG